MTYTAYAVRSKYSNGHQNVVRVTRSFLSRPLDLSWAFQSERMSAWIFSPLNSCARRQAWGGSLRVTAPSEIVPLCSRSSTAIVIQHSTQPLATLDSSDPTDTRRVDL